MPPKKTTVNACTAWMYGPQVSPLGKPYVVGGISTTLKWYTTYTDCQKHFESMYGKDFTPVRIRQILLEPDELIEIVKTKLKNASSILDVLLVHSAIINTYGIIQSQPSIDSPQQLLNIYTVYNQLYDETKKLLTNEEHIEIFVSKEEFKTLNDAKSPRPENVYLEEDVKSLVEKYQLNTKNNITFAHPITENMRKCGLALDDVCLKPFEKITNPVFKPLADFIVCACSFFKEPVPENIRKSDIDIFTSAHRIQNQNNYTYPAIIIKKVEHTYLSQLFQKSVNLLYKPVFVTPEINTKEAFLRASQQNVAIVHSRFLDHYSGTKLNVFQSAIINGPQTNKSSVPISFIESGYVKFSDSSAPTIEFFKGVLNDLLKHKVFIKNSNNRFELNKNFEIEKLDFYKELPTGVQTDEDFKKKITAYFYRFVGNVIHFAVANYIILPFRLSRIYIMELFNLFDFKNAKPADRLQTQLLLVGSYLLEHTSFTSTILKIFEDPEKLLDPEITAILDPTLTGSAIAKGPRVNSKDNKGHIYSTDQEEMFNNMIAFLYTYVSSKVFRPQSSALFFEGFKTVRDFGALPHNFVTMNTFSVPAKCKYEERLKYVNRADIFLSGSNGR